MKTKNPRSNSQNPIQSKRNLILALVVLGLAVVGGIIILFGSNGHAESSQTALQIGEMKYTVAECRYLYGNALQELQDSASDTAVMLGLDFSKPLDQQACPLEEQGSWADYLWNSVCDQLMEVTALCQEADVRGYTLPESKQQELQQLPEYISTAASEAGFQQVESFLEKQYGPGVTMESIQSITEKMMLAEALRNDEMLSYDFSEEELQTYYQEHLQQFSEYSYLYAFLGADSTEEQITDLTAAESEEEFQQLAETFTGRECYTLNGIPGNELGDSTQEDVAWLVDQQRNAGDTYVGHDGDNRYVLYFLKRDDLGFSQGQGEQWKTVAAGYLREERLQQWLDALLQSAQIASQVAVSEIIS